MNNFGIQSVLEQLNGNDIIILFRIVFVKRHRIRYNSRQLQFFIIFSRHFINYLTRSFSLTTKFENRRSVHFHAPTRPEHSFLLQYSCGNCGFFISPPSPLPPKIDQSFRTFIFIVGVVFPTANPQSSPDSIYCTCIF